MSMDSNEHILTSEINSTVPDSSLNETKKKEKRNYCYICQVQCTAEKNFEEHKKGRKHLKKLSLQKIQAKKIQKKELINTKPTKDHHKKTKKKEQEKSHKSAYVEFIESVTSNKTDETMASNYYSSSDRKFNKSNRDNSRSKYKSIGSNRDFQNRSNNHYENYSNLHNYNNKDFYGNARYSNYNSWNSWQSDRAPFRNGSSFNGYLQTSNLYPQYEFNSQGTYHYSKNRPYPYDFNNSANEPSSSQEYNQSSTSENEKSENRLQEEKLNSKNLENCENLNLNSSKNDTSSQKSASPDVKKSVHSNNLSDESISISEAGVVESNCSKQSSSPVPNINSEKKNERRRVRSWSLSSTENNSNEKRVKEGTESQSAESDPVAEQQKIKKWANTLLETNPGQISRLIHPSTYKDKAALNQLITNLAKSKRKENLTKLKSNSLGSNENLEEEESDVIEEEIEKIVESVISVSDNISSISQFDLPTTESNSETEQNIESRPKVKKSKKSSVSRNEDSFTESITLNSSGKLKISKKSYLPVLSNDVLKISNKSDENNEENCSASKESVTEKLRSPSNSEKSLKRKSLMTKSKSKKQRCSNAESSEKTSDDQSNVQTDVTISVCDVAIHIPDIAKTTNSTDSSLELPVKTEIPETAAQDSVVLAAGNDQISLPSGLDLNCEFTADTLMQLFATGSVKVKNEFYDPVIDAIKSVDPNELMNACSNKSSQNNVNESGNKASASDSSVKISKDKSVVSRSSMSKGATNENIDMNPVILGSVMTSDNLSLVSNVPNSNNSIPNSVSSNQNVSTSDETEENATDSSLSYAKDMNLIPKDESHLSPQLRKLIKDLQEIASQEETVKQNLTVAKNKINDYQLLLDEWKNKKKKLHDEEEDLRIKRNDIIKLMQEAVKPSSEEKKEKDTSHVPVKKTNLGLVSEDKRCQQSVHAVRKDKSPCSPHSSKSTKTSSKQGKTIELSKTVECDEITVLPAPVKEVPVIELDDGEDPKVVQINIEDSDDIEGEMFTNVVSSNVPSVFDLKAITGHSAAVNCIVVFEDFLYTCSNDSTAKRFNLKDPSQTIVYTHAAKNVLEIVVEKVQNEALVFTSCSNRVISLFIASSGTKIKTFFQTSAIMSICRGWGKFYSGMADGTINVYNWKYEEKEFSKIEHPAARIATAHQGRLHFLVILSSNGNISLRDAETGLLIRYIKGFVKLPSWLTVYNDLAYLSSSDKTLTILDIMTGRAEKKMYLTCNTTGLGVFEDYIFTISYSGILNCYSKERVSDKKIFYGAGRTGLTCIHVYQNWVFTGNRKGDIAVFKFDPSCSMTCEFGSCSYTFGLKEDLEYHLEKDHLMRKKNLARCHWAICSFVFPPNWSIKDKMRHVIKHLYKNVISIP